MQRHISPRNGRACILAMEIQERIKRRGRICIQECVPQARLATLAYRKVLPLVSRVPETQFPVARLEVVTELAHLTPKPEVEQLIPIGEFFVPRAGVVDATETNTGRDWETTGWITWTRRKEVWNRRVCNSKRIERIGKWHTDAGRAKESPRKSAVERIGCKRHRCEGRIEVRTRIFKIAKYRQVFVADIACKGTIVHLPVSRRQVRRESRKVKEEVIAAALILSAELVKSLYGIVDTGRTGIRVRIHRIRTFIERRCGGVRGRMRQRCVNSKCWGATRTEEKAGKQPTALHTPGFVTTARVEASERHKESVRRNITVTTEHATKAFPKIGDHNDVGLVVPRASFDPCLPLSNLVGRSQVRVPISSADFQTAELMDQEEVDHAGDRV